MVFLSTCSPGLPLENRVRPLYPTWLENCLLAWREHALPAAASGILRLRHRCSFVNKGLGNYHSATRLRVPAQLSLFRACEETNCTGVPRIMWCHNRWGCELHPAASPKAGVKRHVIDCKVGLSSKCILVVFCSNLKPDVCEHRATSGTECSSVCSTEASVSLSSDFFHQLFCRNRLHEVFACPILLILYFCLLYTTLERFIMAVDFRVSCICLCCGAVCDDFIVERAIGINCRERPAELFVLVKQANTTAACCHVHWWRYLSLVRLRMGRNYRTRIWKMH